MTNFTVIFSLSLAFNVLVTFRSSEYYKQWRDKQQSTTAASLLTNDKQPLADDPTVVWKQILRNYLLVYLLATCSDWLQGPYVYALYDYYHYSQHDIAVLFVAGFGSSMVFGSFIGGMADWGGRKRFVLLFAAIYAMSCLTKRT